jgi:molybdopterin converting factor small subunit
MAIVFHIPGPLLSLTDGHRRIEIDGSPATVREALDILFALYPGIRDRVLTEQNQIREHVNLFVGNEELRYLDGFTTPITEGVEITIMQAVSGGSMLQILVHPRP